MLRTVRKNESRAASDERRPKVWRIARWAERFEMREHERRGGLDYVKMFVTAATNRQSNESTQFLAQLEELDHYYPEQRDAYEGRFWRLCRLTATQEDWLRGYLLGLGREPIGDAKLAARLHLDLRAMKATLAALKKVGLLEYVACPDFSAPPQQHDDEPQEPQAGDEPMAQGKGRTSRKGRKTSPAASIRENSGKVRKSSGKPGTLLNEMTNGNSKENFNGQMAKGQAQAQTQSQSQNQSQGNPKGPTQGVSQGQPPSAPTTTPPQEPRPIPPQDVTGEGLRHSTAPAERKPATAPHRATDGPNVVRLGDMMPRARDGLTHAYTLRADGFADEIFALLRAPFDRESREGQRELGNYRAALLDCVDVGMAPSAIEELMAKAKADAAEFGRHRKRYYRRCKDGSEGSPEQYWRFRWNQHFAARLPPKRAGPTAASG